MTLPALAPDAASAPDRLPRDREGRARTPISGYNLGDGYAAVADRESVDLDGGW